MEPNSFSVATKTELSIPLAFDGVIQRTAILTASVFRQKRGPLLHQGTCPFGSLPLDPVLNLYYGDGKSIRGNDDASNGPDSLIAQTFPRDGEDFTDHRPSRSRKSPMPPHGDWKTWTWNYRFWPHVWHRDSQTRQMIPVLAETLSPPVSPSPDVTSQVIRFFSSKFTWRCNHACSQSTIQFYLRPYPIFQSPMHHLAKH